MAPTRTATAVAVLFLAAACGSSATESQTTSSQVSESSSSEQPTTSSVTTAAEEPSTTVEAPSSTVEASAPEPVIDMVEGSSPLEAGLYRTLPLGPQIGLAVSNQVQLDWHADEILVFNRPAWDEDDVSVVVFVRTVGVLPAAEAGAHHPHDPAIPAATEDIPEDLSVWLDSIDQVTIVDEGETSVLDERATWTEIEIDAASGATFECPFGPECIGLVVNNEGVFAFVAGEKYRFYKFDALPGIIAWERATSDTSGEVQELMSELLDGLIEL